MHNKGVLGLCFLGLAAFSALPACAGSIVIYDNDFGGVISTDNENIDAWTVNNGFTVANSFVLSSDETLTGINLIFWEFTGDTVTSVPWAIYDDSGVTGNPPSGGSPTSGLELYSGTATGDSLTDTVLETNGQGFQIDEISITIEPGDALSAGTTYWLAINNVVASNGDPAYWDQSDGPSYYWENSEGYASGPLGSNDGCDGSTESGSGNCSYSESFQLLAGSTSAPEPGTLALIGGGLLGLAGLRRRSK